MTHNQQDLWRSRQLSEMTGEEVAELFRLLQPESPGALHSGGIGARASAIGVTDEFALKLTILEAELTGLRQLLAGVSANWDEPRRQSDALRRARDHSLRQSRADQPAWFCGRASSGS